LRFILFRPGIRTSFTWDYFSFEVERVLGRLHGPKEGGVRCLIIARLNNKEYLVRRLERLGSQLGELQHALIRKFEGVIGVDDHVILCEAALGGQEVAVAFKPRAEWPRAFKFYRLYK
jgi:hypothetical protein